MDTAPPRLATRLVTALDVAAPPAPGGIAARRAGPSAAIAVAALGLGAAADLLLAGGPPGLGLALVLLLLLGAVGGLGARARRLGGEAPVLLGVAATFACALVWRASIPLALLNLASAGAALVLLATVMASRGRWSVRGARCADLAGACVAGARAGAVGATAVARDALDERAALRRPRLATLAAAGRATLFAAPPLVLFATLLASADPVFAGMIARVVDVDLTGGVRHALVVAAVAWPVAGYLHGAVVARGRVRLRAPDALPRATVGEVVTVLATLDLLFLAFAVVQVRHLFGGSATGVAGLTYAEYARRGFLELVAVTALVLPLLLAARSLLGRPGGPGERAERGERLFRLCGGAMLALVLMIVASAMYRMRMYQAAYGLTELRLYASVFMGWAVGVLGLFALTVLQGRRRGLAFGALSSGWGFVALLNVANPDALIVRVNAARARGGASFDAAYATRLSDDAAPALRALAARASGADRCALAGALGHPLYDAGGGWRSWNAGRAGAVRIRRSAWVRAARARCGPLATLRVGDVPRAPAVADVAPAP